jgi:hypothetical protein
MNLKTDFVTATFWSTCCAMSTKGIGVAKASGIADPFEIANSTES